MRPTPVDRRQRDVARAGRPAGGDSNVITGGASVVRRMISSIIIDRPQRAAGGTQRSRTEREEPDAGSVGEGRRSVPAGISLPTSDHLKRLP